MFAPTDPRFDDVLRLANQAAGPGLTDQQRARWRELVAGMLGTLQSAGQQQPDRRRVLRAVASLHVDVLAPGALAGSRVTSSVSAGGLAMPVGPGVQPPVGTVLDLSIRVSERPAPVRGRASLVWARGGQIGVAFIDLIQADRELLEAVAVLALLVYTVLE